MVRKKEKFSKLRNLHRKQQYYLAIFVNGERSKESLFTFNNPHFQLSELTLSVYPSEYYVLDEPRHAKMCLQGFSTR